MSIIRMDLNRCIGCGVCAAICPMDVFYFDETAHKSVLAYPENCQSCGQCYLHCKGHSLGMANDAFGYPITAYRGLTTSPMNRQVVTAPGVLTKLTKGGLPTV